MRSIRRRLTVALTGGLAAIIFGGSAVLYPVVKHALVTEFDYALSAKARALTSFADRTRVGLNLQFTELALPEFQIGPVAEYFQASLTNGTVLARSPSLGEEVIAIPAASSDTRLIWNLRLPDGREGRAIALRFDDAGTSDVLVVFARDRERLQRTLVLLLGGIVVGSGMLLALAAWVIHASLRQGLRPLQELGPQVAAVTSASLETRFNAAAVPPELRPIVQGLNELLESLSASFQREKRFSADVAHELSTPIAELRALTDVALRWPDDPAATASLAQRGNSLAQQMERITRALIALARCESGRAEMELSSINLSAMVTELTESLSPRIVTKEIRLSLQIEPNLVVDTDATMARAIVYNLLDNAIEYTGHRGEVDCTLERDSHGVTFTVTNTQQSLQRDDIAHVFDPLWRKDAARSDSSHCGLGLTLVTAYAASLSANVKAELLENQRFCACVQFPISVQPPYISAMSIRSA